MQASEDIICHQVNCMGVMGGGIAKQIREKYPNVYEEYVKYIKEHGALNCLGSWQLVSIKNKKSIANVFGQYRFGRNKQYTDYDALSSSLSGVLKVAIEFNKSIAIPFNIGCGLAGGSWPFVYSMIEDIFQDYDVTLYRWEV